MLIQDNSTRWNLVYNMIKRAEKKKDTIDFFILCCENDQDKSKHLPLKDKLTDDDWTILREIMRILAPFEEQILRF